MADVLAVAIRDTDRAIGFAPERPEPDSVVEIGSGTEAELVVVLQQQQILGSMVADNIIRGVGGTRPRYWPAGTSWRYVYKASSGESYILRQHRH